MPSCAICFAPASTILVDSEQRAAPAYLKSVALVLRQADELARLSITRRPTGSSRSAPTLSGAHAMVLFKSLIIDTGTAEPPDQQALQGGEALVVVPRHEGSSRGQKACGVSVHRQGGVSNMSFARGLGGGGLGSAGGVLLHARGAGHGLASNSVCQARTVRAPGP